MATVVVEFMLWNYVCDDRMYDYCTRAISTNFSLVFDIRLIVKQL